jgi:hypothetical protein
MVRPGIAGMGMCGPVLVVGRVCSCNASLADLQEQRSSCLRLGLPWSRHRHQLRRSSRYHHPHSLICCFSCSLPSLIARRLLPLPWSRQQVDGSSISHDKRLSFS